MLKNKYKLKNVQNQKIFINEDQTRAERYKHKQIRDRVNEEERKGKVVKIGITKSR